MSAITRLLNLLGKDTQISSEVLVVHYEAIASVALPAKHLYHCTAAAAISPESQQPVWQIVREDLDSTPPGQLTFPEISGSEKPGFEHAINDETGLTGAGDFLDLITWYSV